VTDTVTAKLAEWEALAEGATGGPWEVVGDEVHAPHLVEQVEPTEVADVFDFRRDAEFIAAARTAMPALLGFVREVQHILATQRHEVIGARGVREQDVVRARDIEQAAQKWIGGDA
jgi:hypothetical protein